MTPTYISSIKQGEITLVQSRIKRWQEGAPKQQHLGSDNWATTRRCKDAYNASIT